MFFVFLFLSKKKIIALSFGFNISNFKWKKFDKFPIKNMIKKLKSVR